MSMLERLPLHQSCLVCCSFMASVGKDKYYASIAVDLKWSSATPNDGYLSIEYNMSRMCRTFPQVPPPHMSIAVARIQLKCATAGPGVFENSIFRQCEHFKQARSHGYCG
jgi:hypothetical protein